MSGVRIYMGAHLPAAVAPIAAAVLLASCTVAGGSVRPSTGPPPRDTLPEAITGQLSLFASNPDSAEVATLLSEWAAASRPGSVNRASPAGRTAAAVLWRRSGQFALALRELDAVARGGEGDGGPQAGWSARVELERARIAFARGADGARDGNAVRSGEGADAATEHLWRACREMNATVMRELWFDLRGLLTPQEQEEWESLASGPAACGWIRDMLAERALRGATSVDARLALHYRRLYAAREQYRIPRPRFFVEFADVIGRPDSLEIDDRGLIYLRMGPPHDVAHWALGAGPSQIHTETWAYLRPEANKIYYFNGCSRITTCGGGSDYKLQGGFGPALMPGTPFHQRHADRAGIDPYVVHQLKVLGSPAGPGDPVTNLLDALQVRVFKRRAYHQAREWGAYAIQGIPDAPPIAPRVRLAWEVLRFRDPAEGSATIWVVAAVPAADLTSLRTAGGPMYQVDARLARIGPDGRLRLRDTTLALGAGAPLPAGAGATLPAGAGIPIRLSFPATPGEWQTTLAIRDANGAYTRNALAPGNWGHDSFVVAPGPLRLPAVSDIAVASDSGGSWTRDGRTFLRVDPTHVTTPGGHAYVYFEVYGIEPGEPYEVELRLVSEDDAEEMYELDADEMPFSLQFGSEMPRGRWPATARHHLRLDLRDTDPGSYRLGVRVWERSTGNRSLPVTTPVHVPES